MKQLILTLSAAVCLGSVFGQTAFDKRDSPADALKIAPGAKTTRDLMHDDAVWCRRVWLEPFRKRTADRPWQDAAVAWIERVLENRAACCPDAQALERLQELQPLIAQRCNDPLISFLETRLRGYLSEDQVYLRLWLRGLLPRLDKLDAPRGLAWMAGLTYLQSLGDSAEPHEAALIFRWMAEALHDGSYTAEDWEIFVRHTVASGDTGWMDTCGQAFLDALEGVEKPAWVDATLRGWVEVAVAWRERGGDWAGQVKPEGWKGFAEHLTKAGKLLTHAWQLRPDRPEAAAKMITVAMGGAAGPGETTRLWCDRALAAVCDYEFALESYELSLMPRWGGSHRAMLDFAQSCLRTGRYDTGLGTIMFPTLRRMNHDFSDLRRLYRNPDVMPLVLEASRRLLDEPTRKPEQRMRRSYLAVNAWLADDPALAAETLRQIPGSLYPIVRAKLHQAHADERLVRGEVAVLTSAGADAWRAAQAAYASGDAASARTHASEARHLAGKTPGAAAFLDGQLAAIECEVALAKGDWVNVPLRHGLQGWLESTGEWSARADGPPSHIGRVGKARLIFGARVGADFEVRAEFTTTNNGSARPPVALIFGVQIEDDNWERWQSVQAWRDARTGHTLGGYFHRDNPEGAPAELASDPGERLVFEIRVAGNVLDWKLNGQSMQEHTPLDRGIARDARVGFGAINGIPGTSVTLQKLELRRLPPLGR